MKFLYLCDIKRNIVESHGRREFSRSVPETI